MPTEQTATSSPKPLQGRRGEGLALISQNNKEKAVTIDNINDTLETMLGYAPGEVTGRRIETILGAKEAETISDDLEYDDAAADFGEIFSRIRDVRLRRRTGEEIRVNCNLSRLLAQNGNACFQLVIPNEQERLVAQKLTNFITTNLEGRKQLHPATGLPNHKTAEEFLPLLKNYFSDAPVSIVFAVMRIDRFDKSVSRYGREACNELLKHVYTICRSTFRSEDIIFSLSDTTLGLVLFNISRESTRVVLNRLRWKIRSQRFAFGGKPDFAITTSIHFDLLDFDDISGVMKRCEDAMANFDAAERNALVELGA